MKTEIAMAAWNRREYYEFFNGMDDPYFGVVALADFTECYREAKQDGASFTLYSLHRILTAVNTIEEFHYRVEQGRVVRYDTIHAGPTIGRKDGSFGFGFMEYVPDRKEFVRRATEEMQRVQALRGLCLSGATVRTDTIHFSAVPWIVFTEMKHPCSMRGGGGEPRISTGRLTPSGDRLWMPVSLDAHHGLMDGLHAGTFYKLLDNQELK